MPEFLDSDDVLDIHAEQLARYGGLPGVRDQGALESAVAQAENTHAYVAGADLFDLAAAYLFHIAKNHPFADGNKRAALVSSLVFLALNGVVIDHHSLELYGLTMGVAAGEIAKPKAAEMLRHLASPAA
jgi:death-on-curing protein